MRKNNYYKIFTGQLVEIIKIKGELEKANIIPILKDKNERLSVALKKNIKKRKIFQKKNKKKNK